MDSKYRTMESQMVLSSEDATKERSGENFQETSSVTRKTEVRGRPRAISITPDDFELMAEILRESADFLEKSAKFLREHGVGGLVTPAAKMLDEHLPAVQEFARRSFAEVGPAATAYRLDRATRLEGSVRF